MRRLPVYILALFVGLSTIGCDSNEDDKTDTELFVGSWNVVNVKDQEGDKTALFQAGINSFTAQLNADRTYSMAVDFKDRQDIPLQGTYSIDEGSRSLVLVAGPQQLAFTYVIRSDDRIDLSIQDVFVEALFGTAPETYVGSVTFSIARQ